MTFLLIVQSDSVTDGGLTDNRLWRREEERKGGSGRREEEGDDPEELGWSVWVE